MTVRASAVASSSGSYNSTAHAPTRIQFVKLAGACSGSLLSPARKLLRLSFAGSLFIHSYTVFRSLPSLRTARPSKVESFCASQIPYGILRCITQKSRVGAANLAGFGFQDKILVGRVPRRAERTHAAGASLLFGHWRSLYKGRGGYFRVVRKT